MSGGVREISLTNGGVALVDEADFGWLSAWNWSLKDRRYATRKRRDEDGPGGPYVYMHRVVLALPDHLEPDHINGDGLDNRRANLRACTRQENAWNRRGWSRLGYKGVRDLGRGGFQAYLRKGGKGFYGPTVKTLVEAARSYDDLARLHFGEFARLNFPDDSRQHPLALSAGSWGGQHHRNQGECA